MAVAIQKGLDKTFGGPKSVGSVYDKGTQLKGNFNIWRDGYARTQYNGAVRPLSDDRDNWAEEAALDWSLVEAPCYYELPAEPDTFYPFKDRKVLCRSDTKAPLAVVGARYKAVQPAAVLEFFGEVVDKHGFTLELAGEALNGRRIFALAKCPQTFDMGGGDVIDNHLMFVTHNDGTGATRCYFVSLRLWCLNQMPMLINDRNGSSARGTVARQIHNSEFDVGNMQIRLKTINKDWNLFCETLERLAEVKVDEEQALEFFGKTFDRIEDPDDIDFKMLAEDRTLSKVMLTYETGQGQDNCVGTAYGLLNGATRYIDHDKGSRSPGGAVENNWLGNGRKIKERAFEYALEFLS